jgi:GMP synthase-like glutamine amidotransferase
MKVALSFGTQTSERTREPYRKALNAVNVGVVENPETLDDLTGLVLSGGTDLNPAQYGQTRLPQTDEPDVERDERERRLLRDSLARDLPVLAICRGMQVLNVFCGGTLIQHIEDHRSHGVLTHIRLGLLRRVCSPLSWDRVRMRSTPGTIRQLLCWHLV